MNLPLFSPYFQDFAQNEVDSNGNVQELNPLAISRDLNGSIWTVGVEVLNANPNANQVLVEHKVTPSGSWLFKVARSNGIFFHMIYRNDVIFKITQHF